MKTPTVWSKNPSNESNEYTYDSLAYAFDSSTQNYDGVVDSDLKDNEKIPSVWSKTAKPLSAWDSDISELNDYDSASDDYDSATQNYDGSVDPNRKIPTIWSEA